MGEAAILNRKAYSSDLCARDWQRLEPLLVVKRRSKWPLVEIVNAILYVLKNGCVWRDVPGDLPPWGTAYWYFDKWETDGTWARVRACLAVESREQAKKSLPHSRNPGYAKREKRGHGYRDHGGLRRGQVGQRA